MKITHPVFKEPTIAEVRAAMKLWNCDLRNAYQQLEVLRRKRIAAERNNPLVHGWEPPIWRVCDSLLGLDWVIPERFGKDYGARMRKALGFERAVKLLLILGGNRAGKSEYEAKRAMQCLLHFERVTLWMFHTDGDMSRQYQQPLMWKYMPPEYKTKSVMSQTTYISYKLKTGFSENSFIVPNLSQAEFRNYQQDIAKIEGGELGAQDGSICLGFVADELIPSAWAQTLTFRNVTRGASGLIGFTPVDGYTGTVRMFLDGARVLKDVPAFMLPKDGQEPLRELGVQMENCDAWVDGKSGLPEVPAGRHFETTPRVMRCENEDWAVVFFHSSDNPYGNPENVWDTVVKKRMPDRRVRFYGVADKDISGAFTRFNEKVHVCRAEDVPREGTNWMIVDPCSGRNFFMLWLRCTPDGRVWVVQEWPDRITPIPKVGVMGPWAEPSGDKRMDGRLGEGAKSLGFGLLQYKALIAWLEGWGKKDDLAFSWPAGRNLEEGTRLFEMAQEDLVALNEWGDAAMTVEGRFMDARFANVKTFAEDSMETLLDEFEGVGLTFHANTTDRRDSIRDGREMIDAALYYDTERALGTLNRPKLMISDACRNLIFSMKTWTGIDGQKGATKDPIDCLRMFYLMGLEWVDVKRGRNRRGGGCY
jgi:hypothetical protein